jgi:WD40 repeat protein
MNTTTRLFTIFLTGLVLMGISPTSADTGLPCPIPGSVMPVQAVISGDGQWIFAGSPSSGIVSLFNVNGEPSWTYQTNRTITNVAISADGEYLYAATVDGEVYSLNRSGTHLWTKTNAGCFPHVVLSPSGLTGLIFNQDNPERPYDYNFHLFLSNGTMIEEDFYQRIYDAAMPADGEYYFVNMAKRNRSSLEIHSRNGTQNLDSTPGYWFLPEISDDGKTVTVPSPSRYVLHDTNGTRFTGGNLDYRISSIAISPEGDAVVLGTQFDLERYSRNGTLLWNYMTDPDVMNIALSSHGEKIVTVTVYPENTDPTTSWVSLLSATGTPIWKTTLNDHIGSIAISKNGETIVAGSYNDTVYFFTTEGKTRAIHLSSLPNEFLPPPPPPEVFYWTSRSTTTVPLPVAVPVFALAICCLIVAIYRKTR